MINHLAGPDAQPSRVVLLGRSGFLASHLAIGLTRAGIPSLALGRPDLDLTHPSAIETLSALIEPTDTVVVLAALTPDKGRDVGTLTKNLRMAEHLCAVFERRPCAHVVYVSSDAVYDGRQVPIDEGSSREPVDLYAVMHTTREMMLQSALAARKVPVCVVRPVALFGPGDTHNSYGPNRFVREALDARTITLFGKGEDQRSHVYVEDAARFMLQCLLRRSAGTMNLADDQTFSFLEVAELVRASCPFSTTLVLKERAGSGGTTTRPFSARLLRDAFPRFEFTPMAAAIGAFVAAQIDGRDAEPARQP